MGTIADFNALALAQSGVPYLFGGINLKGTPNPGLDCSGLPYAVSLALGTQIPRTSEAQFAGLPATDNPTQGTLVFYDVPTDDQPQPAHVAIWWAPGSVLQAPRTGEDVGIYPNSALPYEIMGYRTLPFPPAPPPPAPPPPTPEKPETVIATDEEEENMVVIESATDGNRHVFVYDPTTQQTWHWWQNMEGKPSWAWNCEQLIAAAT